MYRGTDERSCLKEWKNMLLMSVFFFEVWVWARWVRRVCVCVLWREERDREKERKRERKHYNSLLASACL